MAVSIFYSPSTNGFYHSNIQDNIPEDAVKITEKQWIDLLDKNSKGQEIYHDDKTKKTKTKVAEIKYTIEQIRSIRDKRLSKTDWTQLPDVPVVIKQKWANYRQELRDLPDKYLSNPENVIWPKEPE